MKKKYFYYFYLIETTKGLVDSCCAETITEAKTRFEGRNKMYNVGKMWVIAKGIKWL